MPSFDIVSEVNQVEVRNAIDQANKEISTRFDFKGSDSRVEYDGKALTLYADDEFKLGQVMDVLGAKFAKRQVVFFFNDTATTEKISGNKVKLPVTAPDPALLEPATWDGHGLASLIPESIAQGLIGHPFGCPDMIGGGDLGQARTGVDQETAKKIVKLLKESKVKVQGSIQGDTVRVSGGKRDDLQAAIALVKQAVTDYPLQYQNFRD